MATKTDKKKTEAVEVVKTSLLGAPRVTEKAARLTIGNAYVFMVETRATKPEIKKAFIAKYKKTPLKIGMTTIRAKQVTVRGRKGMLAGGKKAIIYLKKGETIDLA